ncbi:MAG: hypothetical protein H7Y88_02375 [Phycisphaerales bacterium]|nr:hypothetical protein [Phycisphaerales bacterium]
MLEGLEEAGDCPECGLPYHLLYASMHTLRLPLVRWRLYLPGLAMSVGMSLALAAVMVFGMGNWGAALWLGVPFAMGSMLGYTVRAGKLLMMFLLLSALVCLIFGLMTLQLAGLFCGMALVGVFLGPAMVGLASGIAFRRALKRTAFSQRDHLPILAVCAGVLVWGVIEGRPRPQPPETVATTRIIAAPVAVCWDHLMFYEEVTHRPPWILRVGLARPLGTIGSSDRPGDVKVCLYNKGTITKRASRVVRGEELAFDVIQQRIGYERDVRLRSGSFVFAPAGPGRTLLTLETTYEPLLSPRWCWKPFERLAVHTLHGHVLEGMRIAAETAQVNDSGTVAAVAKDADR